MLPLGLPRWHRGKESTCQCKRCGFNPWVKKIPWRRKLQPTPVFLPWKSHGQRSLVGYSPWDGTEAHRTYGLNKSNVTIREGKTDLISWNNRNLICLTHAFCIQFQKVTKIYVRNHGGKKELAHFSSAEKKKVLSNQNSISSENTLQVKPRHSQMNEN